jgi:hypothetical protein
MSISLLHEIQVNSPPDGPVFEILYLLSDHIPKIYRYVVLKHSHQRRGVISVAFHN